MTKELKGMKWAEFSALLSGIAPDTALGRIVSIRSETDENVLKHFTKEQHRIRSEWRQKSAGGISQKDMETVLEELKRNFIKMAGKSGIL